MKAINKVENWNITDGTLSFVGVTDGRGIAVSDVVAASPHTPMRGSVTDNSADAYRLVLGAVWDCAVVIREKMVMPANSGYAAIKKVNDQLKAHLGDELYEKFLRPNNRVGLPPA